MTDEYGDEIVEDIVTDEDDGFEDNELFKALSDEDGGDAANNDGDDDDLADLEAQDGDSAEVLRTKLTAKNRILRQRSKTTKRLTDRIAELEANGTGGNGIDKEDMQALIAAAKSGPEVDDEEAKATALADLKESIADDPTKLVDYLISQNSGLEGKLASILKDRDEFFLAKIAEGRNDSAEAATPEVMKLVAAMKTQPKYKGVDESVLISFATDLKPLAARVTKRPPARTGGRGRLPFDAKNEAVEKSYSSELDQMGYSNDGD